MKQFILIALTITTVASFGQNSDPNANVKAMGLSDKVINIFCTAAQGKREPNPQLNWDVPVVFELMFIAEKKPYSDFESKGEAYQWIGKMWDEKYSCIYCESDSGIEGSLDMMALYYANQYWVYDLYEPKGACLSNVNAIRIIDDSFDVEGTLIDYIDHVTETRPTTEIYKYPSLKRDLKGYQESLINDFGAKRMSEMTEEEIKRNRKD